MNRRFWTVYALIIALLMGGAQLWGKRVAAEEIKASGAEESARVWEQSVTVFPIVITPSKNIVADLPKRVAEVVGMLLERAGLQHVELAEAMFSPPEGAEISQIAAAFAEFVREKSIGTDYAIFGQFLGTPKTGVEEIRTVVVDRTAKVILADRADRQAFSRSKIKPDCPMTCSVFLVGRIQKLWGLDDPLRQDAPEGKLAQRWRKQTGLPSDEELAEMEKRLQFMKENLKTGKCTGYPVRIGSEVDKQCADQLASMLSEQGVCPTEVSDTEPRFQIQGSPNEQKILWDVARAFREFVRKSPPRTDYALFADYGIWRSSSGKTAVGYVHFIVCNRAGDWVLVDYQNSHHADFQQINPKSSEDCNRLVVKRLQRRLSE